MDWKTKPIKTDSTSKPTGDSVKINVINRFKRIENNEDIFIACETYKI